MRKATMLTVTTLLILLQGCTGIKNEELLYVYALGLDADVSGVKLYALVGSGGEDEGKKSGQSDSDEKTPEVNIVAYNAESIESVFDAMFEQYDELYTGTLKKYITGRGFDAEKTKELEVYIASGGKLPVKRQIESQDNPYLYLQENAAEFIDE